MNPSTSNNRLIAPCGINCGVCYAFLRKKNKCNGCWNTDGKKSTHCITCRIKNCENLSLTVSKFCSECNKYPCERLKQLAKRYSLKYNVNIMDNLKTIKEKGLDNFMLLEVNKWKCPDCGGVICMHKGYCIDCQSKNR